MTDYPGYAYDGLIHKNYWAWITLLAHARNTGGTVRLTSTNPLDRPQIHFNSFNTGDNNWQDDLQAVYEGMMFARKAFADLIPLDVSSGERGETFGAPC